MLLQLLTGRSETYLARPVVCSDYYTISYVSTRRRKKKENERSSGGRRSQQSLRRPRQPRSLSFPNKTLHHTAGTTSKEERIYSIYVSTCAHTYLLTVRYVGIFLFQPPLARTRDRGRGGRHTLSHYGQRRGRGRRGRRHRRRGDETRAKAMISSTVLSTTCMASVREIRDRSVHSMVILYIGHCCRLRPTFVS